jgi:hypothetical protein
MKILRGIGKSLGVLIFSFALVLAIMALTLTKFTSHDNLKSYIPGIIARQYNLTDEELEQTHTFLLEECKGKESIDLSNITTANASLNCRDLEASTPQNIPNLIGTSIFDSFYYRKYDCGFITCLKTSGNNLDNLPALISYKGYQFFNSIQKFFWIAVGLSLILILVSVEKWDNRLKILGINLLIIGIPMLIFGYFKNHFLPPLPEIASSIAPIINQLFSFITTDFLIITIVGAVLTVAGYSLKFFVKEKVKK